MQQTKHTRQACAVGVAARQTGAAGRPGTGEPRPSDAVSAGTATSTAVLSQDSASKAAGSERETGLPPGGFATILVDPPWPLQSGEKHYRTMSLARIKALPVGHLAARDAHLWLWTTNALLPRAYEVAEAWGFTVRSPLTWVKFRLGLGGRYQLRNATEQLLFCTRGRAPLGSRSQPTWFNAPVTEHSRKPAEQFAIIERVSPGQCGATKWSLTSASLALPCRATASGRTRQMPRQRPRQRSGRNRCRRQRLKQLTFLALVRPLLERPIRPAVSALQQCAVAALVTTEMTALSVTARR